MRLRNQFSLQKLQAERDSLQLELERASLRANQLQAELELTMKDSLGEELKQQQGRPDLNDELKRMAKDLD